MQAWTTIDDGRQLIENGNRDEGMAKVWAGSRDILYYEQKNVVASVYARDPKMWAVISAFLYNGVPNDPHPQFWDHVPFGNVANPDDRLRWALGGIFVHWQNWDTNFHSTVLNDMAWFRDRPVAYPGVTIDLSHGYPVLREVNQGYLDRMHKH